METTRFFLLVLEIFDTAIRYAKALSQYDLFWYEEPGDPLDDELQATLRHYYKNPVATGEALFSMSLNIAAGLGLGGNESYPALFQPYGGFPDGVKADNGFITMPDLPGIGFEGMADLHAGMRKLAA